MYILIFFNFFLLYDIYDINTILS